MNVAVMTKSGDTTQHCRACHPLLSKGFDELAEQWAVLMRARFAEDQPQEHLFAFDASHGSLPLSRLPVSGLGRDDPPNSATRFRDIASIARNDVQVRVIDRLTSKWPP